MSSHSQASTHVPSVLKGRALSESMAICKQGSKSASARSEALTTLTRVIELDAAEPGFVEETGEHRAGSLISSQAAEFTGGRGSITVWKDLASGVSHIGDITKNAQSLERLLLPTGDWHHRVLREAAKCPRLSEIWFDDSQNVDLMKLLATTQITKMNIRNPTDSSLKALASASSQVSCLTIRDFSLAHVSMLTKLLFEKNQQITCLSVIRPRELPVSKSSLSEPMEELLDYLMVNFQHHAYHLKLLSLSDSSGKFLSARDDRSPDLHATLKLYSQVCIVYAATPAFSFRCFKDYILTFSLSLSYVAWQKELLPEVRLDLETLDIDDTALPTLFCHVKNIRLRVEEFTTPMSNLRRLKFRSSQRLAENHQTEISWMLGRIITESTKYVEFPRDALTFSPRHRQRLPCYCLSCAFRGLEYVIFLDTEDSVAGQDDVEASTGQTVVSEGQPVQNGYTDKAMMKDDGFFSRIPEFLTVLGSGKCRLKFIAVQKAPVPGPRRTERSPMLRQTALAAVSSFEAACPNADASSLRAFLQKW